MFITIWYWLSVSDVLTVLHQRQKSSLPLSHVTTLTCTIFSFKIRKMRCLLYICRV